MLTSAGVKIAPSTYYAAKTRPPSARSLRDEALKAEISRVHKDNYSVLGARKMHVMRGRPENAERHGAGHVARCTVERLMADLGLPRRQTRQVAQDNPLGPSGPVSGRPDQAPLRGLRPGWAVGRRHSPASGRCPLLCAYVLGAGLCGLRD